MIWILHIITRFSLGSYIVSISYCIMYHFPLMLAGFIIDPDLTGLKLLHLLLFLIPSGFERLLFCFVPLIHLLEITCLHSFPIALLAQYLSLFFLIFVTVLSIKLRKIKFKFQILVSAFMLKSAALTFMFSIFLCLNFNRGRKC